MFCTSEDEIYQRDTIDFEQGAVEKEEEQEETYYETDKQMKASALIKANKQSFYHIDPNNLKERLELLTLETKAEHD